MKKDQASATAYTVLQGQLFSARNPEYKKLFSDGTEDACLQILEASDEGKKRLQQLSKTSTRLMAPVIESLLMPGITLHYVLRKRFIEDAVEQVILGGVKQVVNLGAGFDTLALRLHKKHPDVNFIEVDHPATSKQKLKALKNNGVDNLHLLAVDLSQADTKETMESFPAFCSDRETIFICEGVLMYLQESDVAELFATLKELTNKPTHFVFTCIEPMDGPNNNATFLLKLFLKYKNEPLNWALEQKDLSSFLKTQDYNLIDLAATDELEKRYLKDTKHGKLHHGEYLVFAKGN